MKFFITIAAAVTIVSCSINKKTSLPDVYLKKLDRAYHLLKPVFKGLSPRETRGPLSLRKALLLAFLKNPRLNFYKIGISAGEAAAIQEGLYANPELELEMENFGGGGSSKGFSAMEISFKLSQLFELGGKPSKRKRVAQMQKNAVYWKYILERIDIINSTATAFLEVAVSQESLKLQKQLLAISKKVLDIVSLRVKVGKVSPIELYRAKGELLKNRFAWEKARQKLILTRKTLSAAWGNGRPVFTEVKSDFFVLKKIPSRKTIMKHIKMNPRFFQLVSELEKQKAVISLAKAGRVPDINISAGFRYSQETGTGAFLIGFSIPLPFLNRNQGRIKEAKLRLEQMKLKRRWILLALKARFFKAYQKARQAFREADTLQKTILPNVLRTFRAVLESYKEGKFGLLHVLAAKRSLFEVKKMRLQALLTCHCAFLELERLMGFPLSVLKKK